MFKVIWLPVNQAWAVVFGADLITCSVLAIRNDKAEAEALLDSWERKYE